jgi:hypothetical protein
VDRRSRGRLTPEQERERFSTDGVDFDESLRHVLAGGPDPDHVSVPADDEREADE